MIRTAVRAVLALAISITLVSVTATPAQAGWTDHVAYKRQKAVCVNNGETITIGGSVFQKEFGKHGVTQFRVQWLLYNTDGGLNVAKAKKTKRSATFPNNAKNYWWDGKTGTSHQWSGLNPTHEYRLVAKMTWVRPGKRDWNKKLPVAVCS